MQQSFYPPLLHFVLLDYGGTVIAVALAVYPPLLHAVGANNCRAVFPVGDAASMPFLGAIRFYDGGPVFAVQLAI